MIELVLGWPPKELSPNARLHWAQLARAKKKYREACWATTLEQQPGPVPSGQLVLELEFFPPNRRTHDRDNLTARMKAGLDGMADALKIDDSRFSTVVVKVATDTIGGFVRVRIQGEKTWRPRSTT